MQTQSRAQTRLVSKTSLVAGVGLSSAAQPLQASSFLKKKKKTKLCECVYMRKGMCEIRQCNFCTYVFLAVYLNKDLSIY